ncbi:hypothetical protein ABK040_014052 [Willaertia magna]
MAQTPEQAIEQFLLLGKSVKELLDLKGIKELDGTENQKDLDTLKLFAYGTYSDYKNNKDKYASLSDKNLNKLKQLSIVTLASKNRLLRYDDLLKELDVTNVRELEDLLIDCMYQGLLEGKLDQKEKNLEVYETLGRDIQIGDLDQMISVLKNWVGKGKEILKAVDSNVDYANIEFKKYNEEKKKFDEQVDAIEKTIKASLEDDSTSGTGMMMGTMMMNMMGMMGGMGMMSGGGGNMGGQQRRTRKR